jgi:TolB-like protein
MKMKAPVVYVLAMIAAVAAVGLRMSAQTPAQPGGEDNSAGGKPAAKAVIVVFDFVGDDEAAKKLANSIRMTLARNAGGKFEVLDQLTTQESSQPTGVEAKDKDVAALMKDPFSASLGLIGNVTKQGDGLRAEIRCIDLRPGAKGWSQTFTDTTERSVAVISRAIGEKLTGGDLWKPPEIGDLKEPKHFGKSENLNADFKNGHLGWPAPDNVSTFLEKGPTGHGIVLRMRNDLERDPWLEYRRNLMFGQANPNNPPKIGQDTSYSALAGMEGTDYITDYFKSTPGQRYWLVLDTKGPCGAKIFIKGWKRAAAAEDGLSETALKELHLTPEAFSKLSEAQRAKLVQENVKKHPQRYLSECWDWHMNLGGDADWTHHAGWFPPAGGMPKDVEFLHIKILTIWPPGEKLFDNVGVYKDPDQKAPLDEVKARTPNYGKTSDKVPD